jgi:hypothetical protein
MSILAQEEKKEVETPIGEEYAIVTCLVRDLSRLIEKHYYKYGRKDNAHKFVEFAVRTLYQFSEYWPDIKSDHHGDPSPAQCFENIMMKKEDLDKC